jgi:glycosyltransferase involved in cell wall biosynthesis
MSKILHISTLSNGGAFRASLNIHKALLKENVQSEMWILRAGLKSEESNVVLKQLIIHKKEWEQKLMKISYRIYIFFKYFFRLKFLKLNANEFQIRRNQNLEMESYPFTNLTLSDKDYQELKKFDVIHLHWIADGLDYSELFKYLRPKKIVWTLHDENPIEGFYHFYENANNVSYFLNFKIHLKNLVWKKIKSYYIRKNNITFVAPSFGLYKKATEFVDNCNYIPYTISEDWYSMIEVSEQIQSNTCNILVIAENLNHRRKGGSELHQILKQVDLISNDFQFDKICWNFIGHMDDGIKKEINLVLKNSSCVFHGYVNDRESLKKIYLNCHLTFISSLIDNLPNTLIESLTLGRPVLCYPTYFSNLIVKGEDGFVADNFTVESLVVAAKQIFNGIFAMDRNRIAVKWRNYFDGRRIVTEYLKVYGHS